MNWLTSIASTVSMSSPLKSWLSQFPAEFDSAAIQRELLVQEDSISKLHPDIRELSEKLYQKMVITRRVTLQFDNEFYTQYDRPLAILKAQEFISGEDAFGVEYAHGLSINNEYVIYLCALYEDQGKMDSLVQLLESCKPGQWLYGEKIEPELQLSRPVIQALFRLYEKKGCGRHSNEIGMTRYFGLA